MKVDIQKEPEAQILKKVLINRIENINEILTGAGGSGSLIQEKEALENILFNINRIEGFSIN